MKTGVLFAHCLLLGSLAEGPLAYAGGYDNEHRAHTANSMMSPGSQDSSEEDDGYSKDSTNNVADYSKTQQSLEQQANEDDEKRSFKNFKKTLDAMGGDQPASSK